MLKKHIATVHVAGTLSEFERNLFNYLLENAYPNLLTQKKHTLKYSGLSEDMEFNSNDRQYIKNALRTLALTPIEWIEQDDKGKEFSWQLHTYIS